MNSMANITTTCKTLTYQNRNLFGPIGAGVMVFVILLSWVLGEMNVFVMLFTLLFVAFFGVMFFELNTVVFDVDKMTVSVARVLWNKTWFSQIDLNEVYAVEVERSFADGRATYRVVLQTDDGLLPLSSIFSNGSRNHSDAVQIHKWLLSKTINAKLKLP